MRAALTAGRADPGFSLQRHLIVSMDPSLAGYDQARTTSFYRSALDRVRSLPGVEHASVASIVPYGEFEEDRAIRLKPGDDGVSSDFVIVGSDYFATLGVHVLRGREFTRAEEQPGTTSRAVIIDRPLARKLFKDGDPLDQQILIAGREGEAPQARTIVGVVSEMAHDTFDAEPPPHVFVPSGSMFRAMLTLHVRTAAGVPDAAMLAALRRELLGLNARLPILTATTMADYRYRSLTEWTLRAAATLFGVFGVLALLLATIGVYGLKAYDVARRTREIGIRMALGATSGDVKRLMLREGLRTTMAGLGIGLLLAAGIGKLVSGLLYRVSPFDPLALVSAAAVLATTALLASYVPARRATRVEPLLALRSE